MEDNYSRFSRVADAYARYRPGYPRQLLDLLRAHCDLAPTQVIADIGSGTGRLTELLLEHGNRVYGVEPNPEMRAAAEQLLGAHPQFTSLAARAEATSLPDGSVDMITAGQAFHWFNHALARREFLRILVPRGWVVLVWNIRGLRPSPFGDAFARFWQTYLKPQPPTRPDYSAFFGSPAVREARLNNDYVCDFDRLQGYVLSASHRPKADDPGYPAMLEELSALFERYQQAGTVTIEYETRVIYGPLAQ